MAFCRASTTKKTPALFFRFYCSKQVKYMNPLPPKEELFKTVAEFDLKNLTADHYITTINKLKLLFPSLSLPKYGQLQIRRTICEADKLDCHQRFSFFKVSGASEEPLKFLLSRSEGQICGVKSCCSMVVFDHSIPNGTFAHNAGVEENRVQVTDPPVRGAFLAFSIENLAQAVQVLASGVVSPKSLYYAKCFNTMAALTVGGVVFPGVRDFIGEMLEGREPSVVSHELIELMTCWTRISKNILDGTTVSDPMSISVLKTPADYLPLQAADIGTLLQEESFFYKSLRDIKDRSVRAAAKEAFVAAKGNKDEFKYFSLLEARKASAGEYGAARAAWDSARKIYG